MSNCSIYLEEFTERHDFSDYLKLVNDKKNTYFITDDDISILNNPLPNIIDESCGSSIMKTFDVN